MILVGVVPDGHLVGLGDAQQIADGAHRHVLAEVGDDIEFRCADERIERFGAELAHLRFDLQHAARAENFCQQPPVGVVDRRVLHRMVPGGISRAGEQRLGHDAVARAERLPVRQRGRDVVIPAQRVEAVFGVVVERRLVAQPFPDRVRVCVDLEIVRIVVEIAGLHDAHSLITSILLTTVGTLVEERGGRPIRGRGPSADECGRAAPRQ